MKRFVWTLVILIVSISLISSNFLPQQATTIKFGIYENQPMSSYESGVATGFVIDILESVARRANWKIEYVPCAWTDCLTMLENNEIDLLGPIAYSDERAERFAFSKETYFTNWGIIYQQADQQIETFLDLQHKTIAVIKDDIYSVRLINRLDKFEVQVDYYEVTTYQAVLEAIDAGIVDAGVVSRLYGDITSNEFNIAKTPIIFEPIELRFAAPRSASLSHLTTIDNYLKEWKQRDNSPYYVALDRWLTIPVPWKPSAALRWTLGLLIAGVTLSLGVSLFLRLQVNKRTEELNQTRQAYQTIVEASLQGITVLQNDRLVYVNPASSNITGYSPEEMVGFSFEQIINLVHPDHREKIIGNIQALFAKKNKSSSDEIRFLQKDGSIKWAHVSSNIIEYQDEPAIHTVYTDITERKQFELQLQASENKLRNMIQQSVEGISLADEDGIMVAWNNTLEKITGITSQDVIGKPIWEMQFQMLPREQQSPAVLAALKTRFQEVLITGKLPRTGEIMEMSYQHPDGSIRTLEGSIYPTQTDKGYLLTSFTRDITERKAMVDEIDRQRIFSTQILNHIGQGLTVVDKHGKFEYINPFYCQMLGLPEEDILGKSPLDFTCPEDLEKLANAWTLRLAGKPSSYETYLCHASGEKIPVLITGMPRVENGELTGAIAIITDLTERLNAETALQHSVQRFKKMVENDTNAISLLDSDGFILYHSPAYTRILGYPIEERMGKKAFTHVHKDDIADLWQTFYEVVQDNSRTGHQVFRAYHQDGNIRWLEIKISNHLDDPAVNAIVLNLLDVTEIKTSHRQLEQAHHDWETTFNSMSDWVCLIDAKTNRIIRTNQAGSALLGIPQEKIIGGTCYELVHGTTRMVEWCPLSRAYNSQKRELLEYYDERYQRWLQVVAEPVLSNENRISHMVHIVRDISERKKGELERDHLLEESWSRLQLVESLRSIDHAISTSHDLQTSLEVLLTQTIIRLKVDAADILLFNKDAHSFKHASSKGFRTRAIEIVNPRIGNSLAGQAILQRQIIQIPDLRASHQGERIIRSLHEENFIFYACAPLFAKGEIKGVLEVFHRKELAINEDWLNFFSALAGQAAIAIDNTQLYESVQRTNMELVLAYDDTIEGWSRAMDLRDKETQDHTQRVTEMTIELARRMNVRPERLQHFRRGALLHDIGKMGVPDEILKKSGTLSDAEWALMRQHPQLAYDMISSIAYLKLAAEIPYCHHEKWDGSGYPRGLKGEEIPLSARIFAIVDVWDALTSDRPYRPAWSQEEALQYIEEQSGKHFDPAVVKAFFRMINNNG